MARFQTFILGIVLSSFSIACVKQGTGVRNPQGLVNDGPPRESTAQDDSVPLLPRSPWKPLEDVKASGELVAPLPLPVTSFGAATIGDDVYVLGGYFGTPHQYSKEWQSKKLYRLTQGAESWKELQPLGVGTQGVALVSHAGLLYRIGGMVAENTQGHRSVLRSVPDVARFDPKTGVWERLPDLPAGRSSHDAVVIGNQVYVFGGWELRGNKAPKWHHTMLVGTLSPTRKPVWEVVTVPFARRGLATAAFGKRLAVVGGMNDEGEISEEVNLYNPQTHHWNRAPNFPANGFGVAAVTKGANLYASTSDGKIYLLEEGAPDWKTVGSLISPRIFHRLVIRGDQLLAMGGILGTELEDRVRLTEEFALNANKQDGVRMQMLSFANPGQAKNRQGLFYKNGVLYAFGGNNSLEQHDFEPENFLDEGFRINLSSLAWAKMESLPKKRQTLQVAMADNGKKAVAMGGFGHDGESAKAQGDIFEYDISSDKWETSESGLPAPRTQFGMVTDKNNVWIFGGLNYDDSLPEGKHFEHRRDVLKSSLSKLGSFSDAKADMPLKMRAFASAILNNKIYVVGGMRANFKFVEDAMALDLKSKKWLAIPKPSHARLSGELVALDGKLFLVGGTIKKGDDTQSDQSIEVYDPKKRRWRVLVKKLPFDTRHVQAFAADGKLFLYSANNAENEIKLMTIDGV